MVRASLWKEPSGYTVWTVTHAGDKQECLGHFTRKAAALRVLRAHNTAKPANRQARCACGSGWMPTILKLSENRWACAACAATRRAA